MSLLLFTSPKEQIATVVWLKEASHLSDSDFPPQSGDPIETGDSSSRGSSRILVAVLDLTADGGAAAAGVTGGSQVLDRPTDSQRQDEDGGDDQRESQCDGSPRGQSPVTNGISMV